MGTVKFLVFFFVFLRFFPNLIESAGAEKCPIHQWCAKEEPTIQFPFTLKGRGREECGSPGYQLICNEMNKTVLEFPFSGKFFVRRVYSSLQKIEIYDPENCLPKRILKLNLSGTPYQLGSSYRKYSFLNCSSSGDSLRNITNLIEIRCLSSSTHTVFATNVSIANIAPLNTTCVHIADVQVPILPIQDDDSFNLNEKFLLSWPWHQTPSDLTKPPKKDVHSGELLRRIQPLMQFSPNSQFPTNLQSSERASVILRYNPIQL
ncbi:putative RING-H2 finger protein ATL21B [Papaver somniferum]|uniref:putative RING-H2 finger protein ATL21B n=1 Tax=Papaver somniferum TaxID=3469 RepID=UPI000E6FB120|nr:putative RING-H2 finger protein ATL21B [Papaver somniferum]